MTAGRDAFSRPRRFQPSPAEIGEAFGILFPSNDRLDHRASAHPHHVADDAGELQVGVFEDFLDAQRVLRTFPNQLLPGPRQIAQFVNGRRRHEAAPNQAMGQQIPNPHRVVDVGLSTRHAADLQRVGQDEFKLAVQHVPDRLPIDARRLHGDMGAALCREPVGEGQQILGGRAECAHFLVHRRIGCDACAGDDGLLVDVESGTPGIQNLHRDLLSVSARSPHDRSLENVLSGLRPVATVWGARGAPGPTDIRAQGTTEKPTSGLTRESYFTPSAFHPQRVRPRVSG